MMANDFPYFPFYPDDFSSDGKVEAMTTIEVGAYILLLCKAWKEKPRGTLPNDDKVLARYARLDPHDWSAAKPRVLSCFRLSPDETRWHQKRMMVEARKITERANRLRESGKIGAERRWGGHSNPNGVAMATPLGTPMPRASDSSSLPEVIPKEEKPRRKKPKRGGAGGEMPPIPESLNVPEFCEAWSEWVQYRREKGKRFELTPRAAKLEFAELAEWGVARAIAAIHESIRRGWQGIYEKRQEFSGNSGQRTHDVQGLLDKTRGKK